MAFLAAENENRQIHDSYTKVRVQLLLGAAENTKNGNSRPKEIGTTKRFFYQHSHR